MHYVYVLKNLKQFYIGSTNDLRRHFTEHASNKSFATKNRGPWKLVYYEASESEIDARIREKYLKTAWGKRYLKNVYGLAYNYLMGYTEGVPLFNCKSEVLLLSLVFSNTLLHRFGKL